MRVLIVDDEVDMLEMVKMGIQMRLGPTLRLDLASDAEKAVELIKNQTYDLVVTDLNVPNDHGKSMLELLQVHASSGTQFIIMSGDASGVCEEQHTIIEKPFRLKDMTEAIEGLLGNQDVTENTELLAA